MDLTDTQHLARAPFDHTVHAKEFGQRITLCGLRSGAMRFEPSVLDDCWLCTGCQAAVAN